MIYKYIQKLIHITIVVSLFPFSTLAMKPTILGEQHEQKKPGRILTERSSLLNAEKGEDEQEGTNQREATALEQVRQQGERPAEASIVGVDKPKGGEMIEVFPQRHHQRADDDQDDDLENDLHATDGKFYSIKSLFPNPENPQDLSFMLLHARYNFENIVFDLVDEPRAGCRCCPPIALDIMKWFFGLCGAGATFYSMTGFSNGALGNYFGYFPQDFANIAVFVSSGIITGPVAAIVFHKITKKIVEKPRSTVEVESLGITEKAQVYKKSWAETLLDISLVPAAGAFGALVTSVFFVIEQDFLNQAIPFSLVLLVFFSEPYYETGQEQLRIWSHKTLYQRYPDAELKRQTLIYDLNKGGIFRAKYGSSDVYDTIKKRTLNFGRDGHLDHYFPGLPGGMREPLSYFFGPSPDPQTKQIRTWQWMDDYFPQLDEETGSKIKANFTRHVHLEWIKKAFEEGDETFFTKFRSTLNISEQTGKRFLLANILANYYKLFPDIKSKIQALVSKTIGIPIEEWTANVFDKIIKDKTPEYASVVEKAITDLEILSPLSLIVANEIGDKRLQQHIQRAPAFLDQAIDDVSKGIKWITMTFSGIIITKYAFSSLLEVITSNRTLINALSWTGAILLEPAYLIEEKMHRESLNRLVHPVTPPVPDSIWLRRAMIVPAALFTGLTGTVTYTLAASALPHIPSTIDDYDIMYFVRGVFLVATMVRFVNLLYSIASKKYNDFVTAAYTVNMKNPGENRKKALLNKVGSKAKDLISTKLTDSTIDALE